MAAEWAEFGVVAHADRNFPAAVAALLFRFQKELVKAPIVPEKEANPGYGYCNEW